MKKLFTLALLLIGSSSLFAQPANDDCIGIIDLGEAPICPVVDTFTNVDATLSVVFSNPSLNIPSCYLNGIIQRDVWFSFLVPANGSVTDFTLTVSGVDGPNGSIIQPQIAIYRGDCELDGMEELDCATSGLGSTELSIDLLGLTPGLTYFARINDWTASATPNWGDFVLCLDEYDPVFNMGDVPLTNSCAGTLYDSGGPNGDYGNSQNLTFTICPDDFHQCIFLDLVSFDLEQGFDQLTFYAGPTTDSPQMSDFTGVGGGIQLQAFSDCVTVQFFSDGSVAEAGWELNWFCSPDTCTIPPPSTCDEPTNITSLPYLNTDLSTCNAGNSITSSPCNNDAWLDSEDYIFTYTSPGDECISVSITGAGLGTGVGVFNDCPTNATECLAQVGGGFGVADPMIGAVFLEEPGTYYIVVDNSNNCTPFNIEVQQVECPVVFPSAAFCEDALSLNGCGDLPAIISVAPGQGDAGFIIDGINEGCWGGFPPNFTFFTFQAQADGQFGFIMESANPDEASDIDFQVWGPTLDPFELCDLAATTQPIRSSYAAGADPTGLADIHPVTGLPVTDVCETAAGDDFVSTIDVMEGEYYVVLINDWGGQITSGAVSIGFGATTPGVLDGTGANFQVTADTAICPGESAQLFASGGEVYQWYPADGLSCVNCQDPVATVTESSVFNVVIHTICEVDTLQVAVGLLQVDAGPDQTVCIGEELQIIAGANFANVTYQWNAPAGFLSCTDCPDPIVMATTAGTFIFEVTVTGPSCSFTDEMTMTVLPGTAPPYQISDDQALCTGETTNIGGNSSPGVNYTWTSVPTGFMSAAANPSVTPSQTTTYYLEVSSSTCPLSSFDSVTVTVANLPLINLVPDSTICIGESLTIGTTPPESGVIYSWTPTTGLNNPNIANPIASPNQSTQYTLIAERNGCTNTESVLISVIEVGVDISNPDTILICRGTEVSLSANAFPVGTQINWMPNDGSLNTTMGPNVVANAQTATNYIAQVELDGCLKFDTVYINVDSLPELSISATPDKESYCEGEEVTLVTTTYEPADFPNIEFFWQDPMPGSQTPDSFLNLVILAVETNTFVRITQLGACTSVDSIHIEVVPVASMTVEPAQSSICQGESVQLNVVADPAITDFTWTPTSGLSCTECPDPIASPPVTTTYQVEGEFMGCPVGASATVAITPGPQFQFPDPPFTCPGQPIQLNTFNDPNATYSWTSSDGSLTSTAAQPVVSPLQTTTYMLTATRGTCVRTAEVTITVPVDFTLTVVPVPDLCPGQPATLQASATAPNITFTWTDEANNLVGTGASITVAPPSGTTTSYTVTATDPAGCFTNLEVVAVNVSTPFTVDATADPSGQVAAGSEVTLNATATVLNIEFSWLDNFGEVIGGGNTVSVSSCETEVYTLIGTDATGCEQPDQVTVNVVDGFTIDDLFILQMNTLNQVYEGEEIQIGVSTTPNPIPGASYDWILLGQVVSTTQDTLSEVVNAPEIDTVSQVFTYAVLITDGVGCQSFDTVTVLVLNNPVEVPNVFTPNGDNTNDFFLPVSRVPVTISSFQVWNRWGQLVYDNENPTSGWDGKHEDEEAISDVYVYRIVWEITGGNGKQVVEKGDVTLLR